MKTAFPNIFYLVKSNILLYNKLQHDTWFACFQQLLKRFINLLKVVKESLIQFNPEARIQIPRRSPD